MWFEVRVQGFMKQRQAMFSGPVLELRGSM